GELERRRRRGHVGRHAEASVGRVVGVVGRSGSCGERRNEVDAADGVDVDHLLLPGLLPLFFLLLLLFLVVAALLEVGERVLGAARRGRRRRRRRGGRRASAAAQGVAGGLSAHHLRHRRLVVGAAPNA